MKHAYPEIAETVQSVSNVIKLEEEQFLDVVDRGMPRFEKLAAKAKSSGVISGQDAFDLHQTYGFLIELTETLASQQGLKVDHSGYTIARKRHEATSGRGAFADSVMMRARSIRSRSRAVQRFSATNRWLPTAKS